MAEVGKVLVILGLVLVAAGGGASALGRAGFRALPGDAVHQANGVRVYLPIVTCIVLSVLLTLALWAWSWVRGR